MTDTEKKTPTAKREPTAAEIYEKLVHTPITGWSEAKIIEHKKKCADALAAKRKKNLDRITG